MTGDLSDAPEPVAERIEDFKHLYPRPCGLNTFSVLSLSNAEPTAYTVNVRDLECECPDHRYNNEDGEVCKHLAVALYQAPAYEDVETDVVRTLSSDITDIERELDEILSVVRSTEAHAEATQPSTASEEEEGGSESEAVDPIAGIEAALEAHDLDTEDFDYYVDDEWGSLQIEKDGYLDDDEFSAWQDVAEELGLSWDQNNERNYLPADDFAEAFDG